MLHVTLDAVIWGRAVAQSVTVLFLLGLWLSVLPAKVWVAKWVDLSTSTLGRANIAINVCLHPLSLRQYLCIHA